MHKRISRRAVKRIAAAADAIEMPPFKFDLDNVKCIEGGSWDYPNGVRNEELECKE